MDRDAYSSSFSLALVCGLGYPQESLREPTKTFPSASPCRRRRLSLKKLHDPSTWRYAHEGGSSKYRPIRKEEREELFAVGETREIPQ